MRGHYRSGCLSCQSGRIWMIHSWECQKQIRFNDDNLKDAGCTSNISTLAYGMSSPSAHPSNASFSLELQGRRVISTEFPLHQYTALQEAHFSNALCCSPTGQLGQRSGTTFPQLWHHLMWCINLWRNDLIVLIVTFIACTGIPTDP